ncbi:BBP7 family outer membrane beta-barrel protein [Lacipirellula sp.]|uniref:BBP7 family outer membrane beta-barrel protein n=1 Tax=Lacipirellula sp. TaxID=2691419 RepID=UPI003D1311A4
MSTVLRGAAALFLGVSMIGAAQARPALDAALDAPAWDESSTVANDDVQLTNPLVADAIQLASADEPTLATSDSGLACDASVDCTDDVNCGDLCGCGPKWYASVGAVFLKRDRPDAGTVVAANPAGTPFSSASDFSFNYDAGVDVGLARRLAGGTIVEARYFGVDSTDTNQFVTPGGFIGAGFTGPANTSFNGKYLTMLDSTEINLRRPLNDRLSILGGFRWVELKDEMSYKINGNVATGTYEYNNRLYGAQIGANYSLARPTARWIASAETKVGMYGNVADGGIFEYQGNNFIGGFADGHTTTAFVGEIDLTLGYRLTKHIVVRGGYQMLWMDNVALAGNAASRSLLNPSLLRDIDFNSLFYQGAMTGVDFTW